MRKVIFFLLIFFSVFQSAQAQASIYVSPGISLGWSAGSSFSFGWKVSLGYCYDSDYYYNITYGKQTTPFAKTEKEKTNYSYLEFQRGDSFGYNPFSAGGGIGMTFIDNKVYPKISLYGGSLLFLHLNYTFTRSIFDVGGNLVLPIPFNSELRDLGAG